MPHCLCCVQILMNVWETMVVHGSVTTLLDPTTASVQLDLL